MTWINVDERIPDVFAGKFRIRRETNVEMDAFFYQDAMAWTAFYGQKLSHWWDANNDHSRLDNVTHWLEK